MSSSDARNVGFCVGISPTNLTKEADFSRYCKNALKNFPRVWSTARSSSRSATHIPVCPVDATYVDAEGVIVMGL